MPETQIYLDMDGEEVKVTICPGYTNAVQLRFSNGLDLACDEGDWEKWKKKLRLKPKPKTMRVGDMTIDALKGMGSIVACEDCVLTKIGSLVKNRQCTICNIDPEKLIEIKGTEQ